MSRIEHNIPKLYLILIFRWLLLIMPIIVLFFYENGLNQTQIMILQSIFSIAIIVFEIPSGYFSDVVGRKKTIIIGSVFGCLGLVVYCLSFGFWGFLVAELVLGLGASFISGTDSALLFDTLAVQGRETEYAKIEGRRTSVANFSETTAAIFGGLLATISLRTPFYVETIFMFFTIPVALTLVEPQRHKWDNSVGSFASILKIVKFSLHDHLEIKWLIIYSALVGSSTLNMVWFVQPYLLTIGLPLAYFGIIWAALNFSVGVFSIFAYKIEKHLGKTRTLLLLIPLSCFGYLLTALLHTLWAIPALFIFYFVRGLHGPMLKDYVNQLISSEKRATVLSVKNMMGRLFFTIIGPFVGYVKDIYTIREALLLSGSLFFIFGGMSIFFLKKHHVIE